MMFMVVTLRGITQIKVYSPSLTLMVVVEVLDVSDLIGVE